MNRRTIITALAVAPLFFTAPLAYAETAVAPEVSPPGDIPDNQAFITFASPQGFKIKVPEGWARKDDGDTSIFNDKYNHIAVKFMAQDKPVDAAYAKSVVVPELTKNGRAITDVKISSQKAKAGTAIRLDYDSNSEPNSVTNKQVREENARLYFSKDGKVVEVTMSAPKGADNVDQWNFIAASFRWK